MKLLSFVTIAMLMTSLAFAHNHEEAATAGHDVEHAHVTGDKVDHSHDKAHHVKHDHKAHHPGHKDAKKSKMKKAKIAKTK